MDAANDVPAPSVDHVGSVEPIPRRSSTRTFSVTATYYLSEEGRKSSLLAGGDGRARQEVKIPVPTNRFHLVNVDAEGVARLKLQPRYFLNADLNVIRDDALPTYDAPPGVDDLLKDAARNHQLERAYQAERAEARTKHRDSAFEAHQTLAERFLSDPTRRALEHPKPTSRHCHLQNGRRPVLFDAKRDRDLARQVPPEAYRRFCEDRRARTERNQEIRARHLAVHQAKRRDVAEWVATRGTPDQQDRHAAGVLPLEEVLDGMADDAFAVVGDRPRYVRDGVERLQAYLRQFPAYAQVVVTQVDLVVTSAHAEEATTAQWALKHELEHVLPDAEVTVRRHRLAWKTDPRAPTLMQFGVLVTRTVGPFKLRREYLAPS